MPTIQVSEAAVNATMPDWVKADIPAIRELFRCSLPWRAEMFAAVNDSSAQDRIRAWAVEWQLARDTITLAEAERRWHKRNLRQNSLFAPYRWQSDDGRGTWLTTTKIMEQLYGPEPVFAARIWKDDPNYHACTVHIYGVSQLAELHALFPDWEIEHFACIEETEHFPAHVSMPCPDVAAARNVVQVLQKHWPALNVDTPLIWWRKSVRDLRTGMREIVE